MSNRHLDGFEFREFIRMSSAQSFGLKFKSSAFRSGQKYGGPILYRYGSFLLKIDHQLFDSFDQCDTFWVNDSPVFHSLRIQPVAKFGRLVRQSIDFVESVEFGQGL